MICTACAHENPPENAYCGGCGRALGGRGPAAYTPRHLTERILASRSALEGERKQVTVLFADVVESTALAEQVGAEAWHGVLDELFGILGAGVHRYEGTVNQYTGDGIMALFGAPLAHEDHARRACLAALDIARGLAPFRERMAGRGLVLGVRMGLHSGEVVVGKIGDDLRMDYTAQGATVALAARLEELAEPGCIYVSEETAALTGGEFDWIDRGPQALRGLPGTRRVFELRGAPRARSRLEAAAASGLSPLVGRDPELAVLRDALAEALAGNGQLVRLSGDAGLGKSRLCLELLRHCREERIAAFEASCPSHGHALPYLLIRLLLRALFGLGEDDERVDARHSVAERLSELSASFDRELPVLFELLEIAEPSRRRAADPDERERERERALRRLSGRLIQAWSASEPLVLIVDDVHWIDPESRSLVVEMIEALGWTRTLLVLSGRPDRSDAWPRPSYQRDLGLEPLSGAHAAELVRTLLGDHGSLGTLGERILERSAGNPFFAEELVRSLVQRGALSGEGGAYSQVGAAPELELPESVRALLAARIDRLGEREKRLLRIGSALGHFRDPSLLARVADLAESDLAGSLARLEETGLVRDGGFAHPLTREVADESQLAERRRALHGEIAAAVEALHSDELGHQAEWIAHHWHAAGEPVRARRWRQRAALHVANIQLRREDLDC